MNDSEIKLLLQNTPEKGYKALFDEYWCYAYTIIYSILCSCSSRNDIENCTADVLSDVMMNYDTLHEGSLKAYIGTSARRRAIDVKRSVTAHVSKNVPIEDNDALCIASDENIEENAENSELSAMLLKSIEELGEPDASIVMQKFFFGKNSAETARILGMNPITVRSRLRRALKKLRTVLTELDISI